MNAPAPPPGDEPAPTPFARTPNAERHVLAADNLRRRQLRSALIHGSLRSWRDRRRTWPAVLAGVIVTAVVLAAIAVYGAFQATEEQQRRQEQQQQQPR
jgi:hypothetical protein